MEWSNAKYYFINNDKINEINSKRNAAQKIKSIIKGFFSKCDQIWSFLQLWSRLLKKTLMENFIIYAVKWSVLIGNTEAYLGTCQTTLMTFFVKTVHR